MTISVPWRAIAPRLSTLTMLLGSFVGLLVAAPPAEAIEEIRLTYGGLELTSVDVATLETFAATGELDADLQALLYLAQIDPAVARRLIKTELAIDAAALQQITQTARVEAWLQLLGSVMDLPDASLESWRSWRLALTTAAADQRISILEVLRLLEGQTVTLDIQRAIAVASTVRSELQSLLDLLALLRPSVTALELPAAEDPAAHPPVRPRDRPRDR